MRIGKVNLAVQLGVDLSVIGKFLSMIDSQTLPLSLGKFPKGKNGCIGKGFCRSVRDFE